MKKVFFRILNGIIVVSIFTMAVLLLGFLNSVKIDNNVLKDQGLFKSYEEMKEINNDTYGQFMTNIHEEFNEFKAAPVLKILNGIKSITVNKVLSLLVLTLAALISVMVTIYIKVYSNKLALYTQTSRTPVRDKKNTYGSAKMAGLDDIQKARAKGNLGFRDGIPLGSIKPIKMGDKVNLDEVVTLKDTDSTLGNDHIAAIGVSGYGKSSSFLVTYIINTLISNYQYQPSYLITDPKGELYRLLGFYMEKEYKVNVAKIDFINPLESARVNPFSYITDSIDIEPITHQILESSEVEMTGKSSANKFWEDCEKSLIKALISYYIFYEKREFTLPDLYDVVNNNTTQDLDKLFATVPNSHECKRYKNTFDQADDNIKSNILIGLCSRLSILANNDVRYMLSGNDIDVYDMKNKSSAVFMVIPDDHSAFSFITALYFTVFGSMLKKYTDKHIGKNDMIENRNVNFLIDETKNIGKIANFDKWVTTYRSRKMNINIFFQSLSQMKSHYGDDWETILANCNTKIIMKTTDNFTNEYISKKLGASTVIDMVKTKESGLTNLAKNQRVNFSDRERKLMTEQEINAINEFKILVINENCLPMILHKIYWKSYKEEHKKVMNAINYFGKMQNKAIIQENRRSVNEKKYEMDDEIINLSSGVLEEDLYPVIETKNVHEAEIIDKRISVHTKNNKMNKFEIGGDI